MITPTRFLTISPDNLEMSVGHDRMVIVKLKGLEQEAGLVPGLGVMLVLTPDEARRFAKALHNTAFAAEA